MEIRDKRRLCADKKTVGVGQRYIPGALMRVRQGDTLLSAFSGGSLSFSPPLGARVSATNRPASFSAG